MLLVGLWVGYLRLHRSDEQIELTRYVELTLPALEESEREIFARLERLNQRPGLAPETARVLLVDDLIPRLIRLGRRAAEIEAHTEEVRRLIAEYRGWIDQLIDACRASVQAIDDPRADPASSLARIRASFARADALALAWREHLRQACERHRLRR